MNRHLARLAFVFLFTIFIATGCESFPLVGGGTPANGVDPLLMEQVEALNAEVDELNIRIRDEITASANQVIANARTADERRHAEVWKENLIQRYDNIFAPVDPGKELPEAWVLSYRVIEYFAFGDGKTLFGAQQPRAIGSARRTLSMVEGVMRAHAEEKEVAELRTQLREVAQRHPLTGLFEGAPTTTLLDTETTSIRMSTLRGIGRTPFAALRGVATGVGTVGGAVGGGVTGITGLQDPISNFTTTLGQLPETTRIETEILYRTVETSDMATSTLLSVASFAKTGERFATTGERFASVAETLPEDIRTNLIQALEESQKSQEELRITMQDATRLIQSVEATLSAGDTLAETIKGVVQEATVLSENVIELQEASKPPPKTPPREPGRPFDILEYQQTVIALTETVRELRGTVEQVHQFVKDDSLQKTAEVAGAEAARVIDSAVRDSERLLDKLFIRLAALLVLFFFLLTAYQLVKRRVSVA